MSVLVEAITVVVRNDAVDCCVPGGVSTLAENSPNNTFRTDGKLAAVGFMTPDDVEVYVLKLQKAGLRFVEQGKCRDIAVIDQIHGPTIPCDWIEIGTEPDGTKFVWMRGAPSGGSPRQKREQIVGSPRISPYHLRQSLSTSASLTPARLSCSFTMGRALAS